MEHENQGKGIFLSVICSLSLSLFWVGWVLGFFVTQKLTAETTNAVVLIPVASKLQVEAKLFKKPPQTHRNPYPFGWIKWL